MAIYRETFQRIALEFHQLNAEQRIKWLLSAVRGDIPELILAPDGTPREGLESFAQILERTHGSNLSSTAVSYLQRWVTEYANKPRKVNIDNTILSLFEILAFDPTPATAKFLHQIMFKGHWFDALPKVLRLTFLNVLENQRVPAPPALLKNLLNRNPNDNGVYVFCILATQDLSKALEVLPKLPDTNDIQLSISMSVDWLLEILPPGGRNNALQSIASNLVYCRVGIRNALMNAFEQAGCPLPTAGTPKLAAKFYEWLHTLNQSERNSGNPCKSLFCRV